ncbi:DUF4479 and tRNA-binding domain-containing protein [Periweissella fabaria]|uniref:tRNA-binding domain-containing protein n=1 Tax=Periweissella fabaria TaxID=546157 RepID=A0ABN8BI88_9LACO|nr:DUF4479 and tRNA-binding domain-containing protein [Periweissella fabaria]MCM0597834.1 DUF4479 and tRNA-binding domain-containing protein [Periweissella fabaria]CAH0417283.1 hypothetical protein WFA24289_01615 [Periweissella fabaria]
MLIASYNPQHVGDTLMLLLQPDVATQGSEKKGQIVRLYDETTQATIGFNFFEISNLLDLPAEGGQVFLTDMQIDKLNEALVAVGFEAELVNDEAPKFVIGYVESVTPHPDSDHLQITKTKVGENEYEQIVSGSPNMQADIYVVVARVGAMMPSGLIIWPGELRGVASNGMIVSGRELQLPNAPQVPGALILPTDFQAVGEAFDFNKAQGLFS